MSSHSKWRTSETAERCLKRVHVTTATANGVLADAPYFKSPEASQKAQTAQICQLQGPEHAERIFTVVPARIKYVKSTYITFSRSSLNNKEQTYSLVNRTILSANSRCEDTSEKTSVKGQMYKDVSVYKEECRLINRCDIDVICLGHLDLSGEGG